MSPVRTRAATTGTPRLAAFGAADVLVSPCMTCGKK